MKAFRRGTGSCQPALRCAVSHSSCRRKGIDSLACCTLRSCHASKTCLSFSRTMRREGDGVENICSLLRGSRRWSAALYSLYPKVIKKNVQRHLRISQRGSKQKKRTDLREKGSSLEDRENSSSREAYTVGAQTVPTDNKLRRHLQES